MYLPFRPIKGQSFTLYFSPNDVGQFSNSFFGDTALNVTSISKDGGTFTATSNSATNITFDGSSDRTKGHFYLVLTATEMTADVITIVFKGTTTGTASTMIIYTTLAELSATPTLNSSISDKITAIFQYLFFKRTVTSSAEVLKQSDASTTLGTATLSDDGTTFTKGAVS